MFGTMFDLSFGKSIARHFTARDNLPQSRSRMRSFGAPTKRSRARRERQSNAERHTYIAVAAIVLISVFIP